MQTTYDQLQELKSLKPQAIRQLQARFQDDNNERGLELLELLKNKEELQGIEDDLKYKLDNNISEEPAGGMASQAETEPRTRRDKREATKHKKWLERVGEAAGMDFQDTVDRDLTPEEMNEAVLQQTADVRPTTRPLKSHKASSRFEYNDKGEKVRKVNSARAERNQSKTKAQRKREKSKRFFDNL